MKSDRQASFGCFDKKLAHKVRRRQARTEMEARRYEKAKQELVHQTSAAVLTLMKTLGTVQIAAVMPIYFYLLLLRQNLELVVENH